MDLIASIIVCTHNRADILEMCLNSLEKQVTGGIGYEVIIIDNNSNDCTRETCKPFLQRNPNYRYVFEPNIGLSHARNRGYQEAVGTYVAYIDDDAIAYPDWLQQMLSFIKRNPEAAAFGGPYEGYALVDIPEWFPPEYGNHSLGDKNKAVDLSKEWISGGNIAFKRSVLVKYDGFKLELGMKGQCVSYGEETRLLSDLQRDGHLIYYVADLKIKHLIAEYKMSLSWLMRASFATGKAISKSLNIQKPLIAYVASLMKSFILAFYKMILLQQMPFKRRLYYSLRELCFSWGALLAALNFDVKNTHI